MDAKRLFERDYTKIVLELLFVVLLVLVVVVGHVVIEGDPVQQAAFELAEQVGLFLVGN